MKRFLRSKLVLSLAAIVMIAAAIGIPLTGPIVRSHAQSASSTPPVSISGIKGTFYTNPNNSGSFDPSVLSSPVFTQQFPVIGFNPPSSAQVSCSNSTGIDVNSPGFTDVVPNPNGTCSTIVAQDPNNPNIQAGQGNLTMFQATFTANLTLANAGDVTFNFFSDDGWILASGPEASHSSAQPSYVSGSLVNPPASGYITKFPIVGSFNQPSSPAQNTVTVHFPVSGTFPIEVDYTECCTPPMTLVLGTSFGNPIPPPPPTPKTPTPTPPTPKPVPTPLPPMHIQLKSPLSHIPDQVRDLLLRELERLDVGVSCTLTIVKQTPVIKLASADLTLIELDFKLAAEPDTARQLLDVENAFLDIAGFKPFGCLTGIIKVVTGKDTDVCPINILDCINRSRVDIIQA